MPLTNRADLGTHAGGRPAEEYCRYCYVNGAFTNPGMDLQGMIDFCVGVLVQRRMMAETEAKARMSRLLPGLKRWRKAESAPVR